MILPPVAHAGGDADQALRFHGEALALRRALGEQETLAETLIALGGIELERGDAERAEAHLEEALALARETKGPGPVLLASVYSARLPGGDVDAARAALAAHGEYVEHGKRMEARFRLWELTEDTAHLEEAKRLLDLAVEHVPQEWREGMVQNTPLHRDILKAWQARD